MSASIIINRQARFAFELGESFETGMVLEGWEVKSIRAGKIQIRDSYVITKDGELWLLGCVIQLLPTTSTHTHPDPTRTRKLLLKSKQIRYITGQLTTKGLTCVPVNMHWRNNRIKLEVRLAKGKKLHDKRQNQKDRQWNTSKQRLLKGQVRGLHQ